MFEIEALDRLQAWFSRLPGIGPKSAMRLAYHVIEMPAGDVKQFAQDMYEARLSVRYCEVCGSLTDQEVCSVCRDVRRDRSLICVVRDTRDVMALERTHEYNGVYHVLGGTISPLDGVGPDDLRVKELVERVKEGASEVILATNPDVQGEATAVYLSRLLAPMGGELEYTDEVTLLKALEGRRSF